MSADSTRAERARSQLFRTMRDWAWLAVIAAVVVAAVGAVAVVYSRAPAEVGLPLPTTVRMVPAAAGSSYPVDVFCNDPGTTAFRTFAPDGPALVYLLSRGDTEQIQWSLTDAADQNRGAIRYFIKPNGEQDHDNVIVNDAARDCIFKKGGAP